MIERNSKSSILMKFALEKKWILLTYPGMSQRVSSTKQKFKQIEVILPARGLNVFMFFFVVYSNLLSAITKIQK